MTKTKRQSHKSKQIRRYKISSCSRKRESLECMVNMMPILVHIYINNTHTHTHTHIYIYIGKDFVEIYPTDLELKVEHNGSHATFIDVDISINKGKLIYKMLDKKETFNFHTVRMPSITSNILSIIFYSFTMSEFVKMLGQHCYLKTFCL